jgi:hypothetical protein
LAFAKAKAKAGSKAQPNTPLEEKRKPQQNNIGKTNLKDPRVLIRVLETFRLQTNFQNLLLCLETQ